MLNITAEQQQTFNALDPELRNLVEGMLGSIRNWSITALTFESMNPTTGVMKFSNIPLTITFDFKSLPGPRATTVLAPVAQSKYKRLTAKFTINSAILGCFDGKFKAKFSRKSTDMYEFSRQLRIAVIAYNTANIKLVGLQQEEIARAARATENAEKAEKRRKERSLNADKQMEVFEALLSNVNQYKVESTMEGSIINLTLPNSLKVRLESDFDGMRVSEVFMPEKTNDMTLLNNILTTIAAIEIRKGENVPQES